MRKLKKPASKIARFFSSILLGVIMIFSSLGLAQSKLKTVPYVDLNRYMGDWNVIAYIPNFIEKGCVSSVESYALREDGKIDNWFVCKKSNGTTKKLTSLAWVHNTQTQAEWKIRFNLDTFIGRIPMPLRFSYLVIDLDSEQYSYTVVGHPSRRLLWIMAREKTLDEGIYQRILARVKDQGYDISKLIKLNSVESPRKE